MSTKSRKKKSEKTTSTVSKNDTQNAQNNVWPQTPAPSPSSSNFKSHIRTAAFRIVMILIITVLTRRFQSDVKTLHDDVIPYKVVEIPGKGKGMVASRNIERGERIIAEKPLFLIPQTIKTNPIGYIDDKLAALSQEQQYEFFNLSHADPDIPKSQLPISIIQTNGIAAGPDQLGIFPRTARMNHGCSSAFNAVYSFKQKENLLVVHALKNISEGEELLTPYFDTKKPRDQRRQHLLEHYKFHCTCSVCSLPIGKSLASDTRLHEITRLKQVLSTWGSHAISGEHAIDTIRSIWKLSDEEGYYSERGQWASDAVHVAVSHSDETAAKEWALLAQEWFGYELGQDSDEVANMRSVVENPRKSPNWGTRSERMNVGSPNL